jgi:hypothetical protein
MHQEVLSGIRPSFPGLSQSQGQVTHVLLTRSPLEHPRRGLSARLACVKHAASVRPEPGSNSPTRHNKQPQHPNPNTHAPGQKGTRAACKTRKKSKNPNNTPTPTKQAQGRSIKKPKEPITTNPTTNMEPTATRTRHYGSFKHAVEFSKNGHPPTKPAGLDGATHLSYRDLSLRQVAPVN